MISQLKGEIVSLGGKSLILSVNGIGFKIFASEPLISNLKDLKEATIFTYMAVRENAFELYGFENEDELGFFELLISISGIGPKSALSIVSLSPIPSLVSAISAGDIGYLTKVSGIGKKTAEKIVLELKEKVLGLNISNSGHTPSKALRKEESDALLALQALGYLERDAREAIRQVEGDTGTSNLVKEALKILSQ